MKFDRDSIAEFKAQGKRYISWRKNIKPFMVRDLFYDRIDDYELTRESKDKEELNYCEAKVKLGEGVYRKGVKYSHGDKTYYMFWSTDSYWTLPRDIFVGKLVGGSIHLIGEQFSSKKKALLRFVIIPQEYVENVYEKGELYQNMIIAGSPFFQKEAIFDKDIECLKNAYEGIRAFSKLIHEISKEVIITPD